MGLDNLAHAFPDLGEEERRRILAAHYRDLGMMLVESVRGRLSTCAPPGEVVREARGLEHLEAARAAGRGAIVLTGHYGAFGVLGGLTCLLISYPLVELALARFLREQASIPAIHVSLETALAAVGLGALLSALAAITPVTGLLRGAVVEGLRKGA